MSLLSLLINLLPTWWKKNPLISWYIEYLNILLASKQYIYVNISDMYIICKNKDK